jgi:transmembrane sensor
MMLVTNAQTAAAPSDTDPTRNVIAQSVLEEAARWFVRMQEGALSPEEHAQWQQWCSASPVHALAWQRAESFSQTLTTLASPVGAATLKTAVRSPRRRQTVLGALAILAVGALLGYRLVPQPEPTLYQTSIGEQRTVELGDGTRLTLNTATAVTVAFDSRSRQLTLDRGQVLIETGHEAATTYRPFRVATADGVITALGTRFTVGRLARHTDVGVLDGRVQVQPQQLQTPLILGRGESTTFSATHIEPGKPLNPQDTAWTRGLLIVDDMPLPMFLAELQRYRHGELRCAPTVAGLRISGAFPLTDIDRTLASLADTLPVTVQRQDDGQMVVMPR